MRCLLLVCLGLAGCGGGGFVPRGDGGAKPDLAIGTPHDGAMSLPDFSSVSQDGGGVGSPCMTACDCDPGLACINQQCAVGIMPVYCCSSDDCPVGQQCQDEKGNNRLCGGGVIDGSVSLPDASFSTDFGLPMVDGGLNGICMFLNCQDDLICLMFGCGGCNNGFCAP